MRRVFDREAEICAGGQINREITYFRDYYRDLAPACMIVTERTAFFEPGGDLRLTIDENPRYRSHDLDLRAAMTGTPLLPEGSTILEVKVQQAVPLWLSAILDREKIYLASISKYGEAYRRQVLGAAR